MMKRKQQKPMGKANKKFRGQQSESQSQQPVCMQVNKLSGPIKKNRMTEALTSFNDSSLMDFENLSDFESNSDAGSVNTPSEVLKHAMENLHLSSPDTFDSDDQSVHNVPERRRLKRLCKSNNSSRCAQVYGDYVKDYPKNLLEAMDKGSTVSEHDHISTAVLRTRTWCSTLSSNDVAKDVNHRARKSKLKYHEGSPRIDSNVIMVGETPPGSPRSSDVGFTFTDVSRNEPLPIPIHPKMPKTESYYQKILSNGNIWSKVKLQNFLEKRQKRQAPALKLSPAQLVNFDASTLNNQLEKLLDQLLHGTTMATFSFNELETVLQNGGLIGPWEGSLLHSFMKSLTPKKCQRAIYLLAEPKPDQ